MKAKRFVLLEGLNERARGSEMGCLYALARLAKIPAEEALRGSQIWRLIPEEELPELIKKEGAL